jgi:hypothetical protein
MRKPPTNSALGRKRSAQARTKGSKADNGRIMMDIVTAVNAGADRLRILVKMMNEAGSRSRSGLDWSIPLVSLELGRYGMRSKDLFKRKDYIELRERTNWSEKSYWRVVEEQQKIADRNGKWTSSIFANPKRNDPVRHSDYGIGYYHETAANKLRCLFHTGEGRADIFDISPVDTDIFVWSIGLDRRDAIFSAINERFLVEAELVPSSSITLDQLNARKRAVRWK